MSRQKPYYHIRGVYFMNRIWFMLWFFVILILPEWCVNLFHLDDLYFVWRKEVFRKKKSEQGSL